MKLNKIKWLLCLVPLFMKAQALPIILDESYDDWEACTFVYTDIFDGETGIDLQNLSVANDETWVFFKIETTEEFDLSDDNDFAIYLDTDLDANTGFSVGNIGAELSILTGDRSGFFNIGGSNLFLEWSDLHFRSLPTVTSNIFEIAIKRDLLPDGLNALFPNATFQVLIESGEGDQMPENDETFIYTFDENDVPFEPINFEKKEEDDLRITAYNVLQSGLEESWRIPSFERILTAIDADIVTFSEAYDMTEDYVLDFMNGVNPDVNWHAYTHDDLAVVSRYPILETWVVYWGRIVASLIDLPDDIYPRDILVFSAHLSCCDHDELRQEQVDTFIGFIKDAKKTGGDIELEEGTPFILTGDLNLVGLSQQLETLVNGDIVDNETWGMDILPDWDDTPLTDQICLQTDRRMAYTWRNDYSSYPPGRLDFMIFSDKTMENQKAFTIQTEVMPSERLAMYNLLFDDTGIASDHFPVVADFKILPPDPIAIQPKILLEGCYDTEGQMQTNLTDFIPFNQPYNIAPYFYEGNESLENINSEIVDWVLVEVSNNMGKNIIETQAAILWKDGNITNTNGGFLRFNNPIKGQNYHIGIRHRNHLSILSQDIVMEMDTLLYDFTEGLETIVGDQQMTVSTDGKTLLFTGDCNQDGSIQTTDFDKWKNEYNSMGYQQSDFNLDGQIDSLDYLQWSKNNAILRDF